tara:strand:- start:1877 stop:2959 length:1083 start_codon:yes stop_codon:yes gene_type:complete
MNRNIKFLKNKVSSLEDEVVTLSKSSKNNLLALDSSQKIIEKLREGNDQSFMNRINKIEKRISNFKACELKGDVNLDSNKDKVSNFPTFDNNNTKHFKIKNIKVGGDIESESLDEENLSMQTGSENIAIYSNDNEEFCSNSEIEDTSSYNESFDINMDEMDSNNVKLEGSDFDDVELLETKKIHKSESKGNSLESYESKDSNYMQTSIINGNDMSKDRSNLNTKKNINTATQDIIANPIDLSKQDITSAKQNNLVRSELIIEKMVVNNTLTDEKKEELINSVRSSDNLNEESESNSKKSVDSENDYSESALNKMKLNELQCLAEEKDIVIVKINGKKKTKKELVNDLIVSSNNLQNVQTN